MSYLNGIFQQINKVLLIYFFLFLFQNHQRGAFSALLNLESRRICEIFTMIQKGFYKWRFRTVNGTLISCKNSINQWNILKRLGEKAPTKIKYTSERFSSQTFFLKYFQISSYPLVWKILSEIFFALRVGKTVNIETCIKERERTRF